MAGVLVCSRNNGSSAVMVLAGSVFSIIAEWYADLQNNNVLVKLNSSCIIDCIVVVLLMSNVITYHVSFRSSVIEYSL